jgi:hypothetical protein
MKKLPVFALALLTATPLAAQSWSVGASTGPFVFGDFVSRTIRTGTETSTTTTTITLSGAVRPGIEVDLQNDFAQRWGIRAEGTFTESKLKVKNRGSAGVNLDAGKMDVTTLALPLIFHINPNGTFRFHLFGGPAYAMYHIRNGSSGAFAEFGGTRSRAGWVGGGGVDWWLGKQFAVTADAEDIVTGSPFRRSDFPASTTGLKIKRPNNVHTTIGVRYRF